jgi:AraC-like DNA-binding protein
MQNSAASIPLKQIGLLDAGVDRLSNYFCAGTRASPTHLVWLVVEGEINFDFGTGTKKVGAGELLIAPVGKTHWINLASSRAKGIWFHFLDLKRWEYLGEGGPRVRPSREIEQLDLLMELSLAESDLPNETSSQIAFHYNEIIALILLRELGLKYTPDHVRTRQKVEKLRDAVNADLKLDWTVAKLASQLNVSTSFLHKLVLRQLGQSPMQMVLQLRMKRAMELLNHTGLSLDHVAEEVGYGTSYAFSDAFLRHSGIRPGAFREQAERQGR